VNSGNYQTNAYGNYRIGGIAAYKTSGVGDLTVGSTNTAGATGLGDSWLAKASGTDASVVAGATATGQFKITSSSGTYDVLYNSAASAADMAAAVNRTNSGVTASAITQVVMGGLDGAELKQNKTYTFQLSTETGSGVPTDFTTVSFKTGGTDTTGAAVNTADHLNAAIQAFNDASGKTGFTASAVQTDAGDWAIKLTSESGQDLRISNDSAAAVGTVSIADIAVLDGDTSTASALGVSLAAGNADGKWDGGNRITGRVLFDSDKSFSITTTVADAFKAGAGTYGGQLQKVSALDVSSYDAALRTLSIVDSALTSLTGQRARYGATQTRFENTISNLQTTSENLSASRSRILDTDFAAETANLTRAQILQQAGVAMLAQANALPNSVLTLLQG
jgi:flagellin